MDMKLFNDDRRIKCSGVYIITNNFNNKRYVGSSKDCQRRFWEHQSFLKAGKHPNSYLQYAYSKYGGDVFTFEVIEKIDEEKLLEIEQQYIDVLMVTDTRYGYNLSPIAGKVVHTKEVRRKISEANKGRPNSKKGLPRTQEMRNKVRATKQADPYVYTDEVKQSMKDAYAANREHRLKLLAQARQKLREIPFTEKRLVDAKKGSLKAILQKKTMSDRELVSMLQALREDSGYKLELTGYNYCTINRIFKIPYKTAYLPILSKIGYVAANGTGIKDLRSNGFLAKLSLDIEFPEGSDNLIEDPVELYNFLKTLNKNGSDAPK